MAEGIMVFIIMHALILFHTTEAGCHDKIDLVFLIDASGSVGAANFRKMKSFVANSVSHFTIGPNDAQVGAITFSSQPHFQFALNKYTDKSSLSNAIQKIPYQSGGTNTDIALTYVEKNTFTAASGNRIDAQDILVIITDGKSSHPPQTALEANRLKQRNVEIIVVGIGHADISELTKMASDPASVLYATDFDSLSHLYDAIHSIACILASTTALFTTQTTPTTTTSTTTLFTTQTTPTTTAPTTTLFTTQTTPTTRASTTTLLMPPFIPSGPCIDEVANCNQYGVTICHGAYKPWSAVNCAHFCEFCHEVFTTLTTTTTTASTTTAAATTLLLPPFIPAGPCIDEVANCNQYGVTICHGAYKPWSTVNCAHFCEFCHESGGATLHTFAPVIGK